MSTRLRIAIGLGMTVLLAGVTAFLYRDHIAWYFHPFRQNASSTPVTRMPVSERSGQWYRYQVGSLTPDLPESLHSSVEVEPRISGAFRFEDAAMECVAFLPADATSSSKSFHANLPERLQIPARSIMHSHVLAYKAAGSDFRWSMSRDELEFHQQLIGFKNVVCNSGAKSVETSLRDNGLEGLLVIFENAALFEWYSADSSAFGTILFDSKTDKLDLDDVRAICASLAFDGRTYPGTLSEDVLQMILDDAKIEEIGQSEPS